MPRLLHTADWQIGRAFASFDPDDAVPLAEARFAAVERLAALAAEHAVDAVLVAGDVFDAQTVSARSIRRLFNALAGFAGPWVMIPGNHDAALADSVWTHAQRLGAVPAHVQLLLQPGVLELPALRLAVLAAPLTQRHTHGDTTAAFDGWATPEGWLRVGLAHGAVQGVLPDDIDAPNPIAPTRAANARLDYLALGDWHGTRRIDDRTWYAGTPEPDRFRANDSGQALLVDLDGPGAAPRVQPLRVAQHRWQQLQHTLHVPSDLDTLAALLQPLQPGDVVELALAGQVDLATHQQVQRLLDEAEARVRCLRRDTAALQLRPTDADLAALQADGYVGAVLADLRGSADPVAQHALQLLTTLLAARQAEGPP